MAGHEEVPRLFAKGSLLLGRISEPECGRVYQRKKRGTPLKYQSVEGMHSQSLPFEKRCVVWKTIESMEAFQVMPQKPHFRPLDQLREDIREGTAVGLMVNFAGVVETTAKLKFGDSRSIIDSSLTTLLELENHGFNVELVRGRLNELLSKKERQGELQEKSIEVEKEMLKRMEEKTKIDEEINELEKKLVLAKLMNETKDKEIAVLQTKLDAIDEDLRSTQHDFGRLVASPW